MADCPVLTQVAEPTEAEPGRVREHPCTLEEGHEMPHVIRGPSTAKAKSKRRAKPKSKTNG